VNAKKVKKVRRLVGRLGKDWRQATYKWFRREDPIKMKLSLIRMLDPDSGRGTYRRLKAVWGQ
jgi:hypothetical protein